MKKALLVVDIQNDFLPRGALPVPNGDKVIPVANMAMRSFATVIATQDWHPADHKSFASQHPGSKPGDVIMLNGQPQTLWPDHCVQNTHGADFPPALDRTRIQRTFRKGTDREFDSYSGFYDNAHRKSSGLAEFLSEKGIVEITIIGLTTEYCVKFTSLDARALGLKVVVVKEGIRGVELNSGDCAKALETMRSAGVIIRNLSKLG